MGMVYGVGIYEKGKYLGKVNGQLSKEYRLWRNMLERCYSESLHSKHPTYIGCKVSENFKNFQWFAEWCQSQIGFNLKDYQMDKDISSKGNKLYSEDTCFFVPRQINTFLTKRAAGRGKYAIGVDFIKATNKFRASCSNSTSTGIFLGSYSTEDEAFNAYKTYKESQAKELAVNYLGKFILE
jgi:hypothetical protein